MKLTIKQLAHTRPYLTEASIRWFLFNRARNGLSCAVIKLGRRLLVDEEKFDEWVNSHREA
ncbi:hypothetical protein LPW11_04125 [Geomonas sp. RF6]|uniref:hypothetical protein n=1 Tax=Geomonas sp. RF6 TaxID=2897342 RepID=UPI001E4CBDB8|nr:hypothetical protein [Geomonas sp. RF6]UFS71386.1 hypothetical protein LPW11_04125 [Geomonas sp. RF6]